MRAIFISYRRDDTEGYAGRLFEDLCERFGKDAVFMDVAGIEPGRDFRRAIEQQVASCGVLLAVIGKSWLTVADAQGRRRLDDPNDFVRLETAGALKRDIPVIPVLVSQARMPGAEQLPDDLKELAYRNSVELTHAKWGSDVEFLLKAVMPYVDAGGAGTGAQAEGSQREKAQAEASQREKAQAETSQRGGTQIEGTRSQMRPPAPSPALAQAADEAAAAQRSPSSDTGARQGWVIAALALVALGGIGYFAWDRFGPGADATGTSVSAPVATTVAPSPAPVLSTAAAPVPSASTAAAPAPVPSASTAPAPAAGPAALRSAAPAPRRSPVAAPAPEVTTRTAALAPSPPTSPSTSPSFAPKPNQGAPAAPVEAAPALSASELDLFGSPAAGATITRTIVLKPETHYVNVTGGEVIRFQVGEKSFVWSFNGTRSSFDLARVAPGAMVDHKVTAYVAPNPLYPRRR